MEPRGLRNNNPANIRRSKDKWKGLREVQDDPEFFQFEEMKWGYRAMLRVLQNYRKLHGCETIADFINRWAPPTENDTTAYIKAVCQYMQVPSLFVPNIENKECMCIFAAAMSLVENGREACMEEIRAGWDLL